MSDLDPSLLLERIRAQIGGTYYGASFTDSLLTDCANVISAISQELKAANETDVAKSQLITDWRKLAETDHAGRVSARAEVQRLREQLQRIADPDEITPPRLIAYNALLAAAALTEPEETK